jgi:hypothetical protein
MATPSHRIRTRLLFAAVASVVALCALTSLACLPVQAGYSTSNAGLTNLSEMLFVDAAVVGATAFGAWVGLAGGGRRGGAWPRFVGAALLLPGLALFALYWGLWDPPGWLSEPPGGLFTVLDLVVAVQETYAGASAAGALFGAGFGSLVGLLTRFRLDCRVAGRGCY